MPFHSAQIGFSEMLMIVFINCFSSFSFAFILPRACCTVSIVVFPKLYENKHARDIKNEKSLKRLDAIRLLLSITKG